ncbi:MAG: glycosyltransferase family 4 protein [Clostridia bacterium]|nr:glycosyltransferase family 4 protein [Clostridia bacterium]
MSCVLELMDYTAPYAGNFIPSIVSLARTLRENGTETVLVFPTGAQDREWIGPLQAQGFPIFFLPPELMAAVRLLRRVCGTYGVTCAHSHFIDHSFYVPLRIACFGRRIAHVYHAHSMPHAEGNLFLRRALMHTRKVLCVSDAVRDAMRAKGFGNCVTVPNGVDFARLELYEKADLPHPLVLMFGHDFFIKGIDTAINAFERFDPAHRYTLGICVAGHEAQAEQTLRTRYGAPPWVRLLGPRADVGTYYRAADVFLSASRTEGMPYAVLEAAWCGLPLVLSDIPQHTALNLPQAQLFSTKEPKALFAALERAVQTGGENVNRAYVEQRFSMQKWTQAVFCQLFPDKEQTT